MYRHRIRLIFFALIAALIVITGCSGKSSEIRKLKIAHGLNVDHPVHKGMVRLAELAYEKSNGTLIVDIYPSEQLGNEKECIEELQLGILSMTKVSSSVMESFVPKLKVLALPYLFRNSEHNSKVLSGPIGKELLLACEPKGLRGLCFYDAGARSFYTIDKPILHPDSLKGMKIRVQQSPMAIGMVKALGGSATPIAFGELYTALQQGMVDGAENNEPSLYTSNHYEVAKYYSLDEHTMVPDVLLISTRVWESLSDFHRECLQSAADESVPYQQKLWDDFVKESMDVMTTKGLQVYHPDKEPFMEMANEMYKEFDGTAIGELAKRIQEVE